ncbi:DUF6285 domain-containing protein [Zhongshania aliphaticivorans]|uniref:DUF6285 domain-containing protein n=1 Tax=Zhongshania aliphaticivorans TaxID=1470434 RepID=UPI0012E6A114|nr:DUF6285 domain-containing protein [Zhongshania aliphaticivorans]CAA0105489.1 Uncharacterised protein [Zhongshania aliphaticivorans]
MPISQPNVSQLCDALQEFLTTEVAPAVDDEAIKYKLKIATNVLGIIARESEQGGDFRHLEHSALNEYLGTDSESSGPEWTDVNQRLLDHIRSGDIASREDDLLATLERITIAKMAIDNPRYASYLKRVDV